MSGRARRGVACDRGQAAVASVLVVAALFAATLAGVAAVGRATLDQARAQTAADSAALGALDGGRPAAVALARAHGAELVGYGDDGNGGAVVTVTVRIGERTASASASAAPTPP